MHKRKRHQFEEGMEHRDCRFGSDNVFGYQSGCELPGNNCCEYSLPWSCASFWSWKCVPHITGKVVCKTKIKIWVHSLTLSSIIFRHVCFSWNIIPYDWKKKIKPSWRSNEYKRENGNTVKLLLWHFFLIIWYFPKMQFWLEIKTLVFLGS